MDGNSEEFSANDVEVEQQLSSEHTPKDNDNDNMDSFPLGKLQEVEDQLSQIVTQGIQDTSFMRSAENCVLIWEHTNKLFPEPQNDDFEVDVRLKNVIRAMGEGSVLPLSELVAALRMCIQQFCDFGLNFDDKLHKLVPIFLNRKNLGEPYVNLSGVVRSECRRSECMWVWESPNMDVFPTQLVDQVKGSREARNLISRRYKALSKLKNCIITEHVPGQQAALEVLNALDRKVLQEKERKEKMDMKRKMTDTKKKNEKTKVQRTNSNMLLSWLKVQKPDKDQKTEQLKESPRETQPSKPVPEEPTSNIFIDATDKQKAELESILSALSSSAATIAVCEASDEAKVEVADNESTSTSDTLLELNDNSHVKKEAKSMDIFELSNLHRDVWTRFHLYLGMNRQFYVDVNDEHMLVNEPLSNVEPSNHNSAPLNAIRHCRVFGMFDNAWKRPPMRYLVGRRSNLVTQFNQVAAEPNVDYCVDSDEDWFERYDADDVEMSEDEEEDEEDEDQEWIVQDSPPGREFSTGVFDNELSKCVKVFCIYRNWHWIIDGKPVVEELSSKELAAQNGINLTHSEFGFGFEGYTRNPIADLMSKLRGTKITMSRSDVEELLKLCHGKHTRKEELIAAFKESKPFASTSEIKNKFKKYLSRVKIDDRPHRWMVTPEAAKLFNIRRELDRILTDQLNFEILSEPIF